MRQELKTLDELIEHQQKVLLSAGLKFVPNLTMDDILQPNDYPELEENPYFRYEEGILAGLLTARTALYAALRERELQQ